MKNSKILWIDLQPSLYCLFKRTAQTLGQHFEVKRWSFEHDLDKSCDINIVHRLLKQTIENSSGPIHLIGHGLSGTIAYLFTEVQKNCLSLIIISRCTIHKSMDQPLSEHAKSTAMLRFHILNHLSRLLIDTHADHVQNITTRLLAK